MIQQIDNFINKLKDSIILQEVDIRIFCKMPFRNDFFTNFFPTFWTMRIFGIAPFVLKNEPNNKRVFKISIPLYIYSIILSTIVVFFFFYYILLVLYYESNYNNARQTNEANSRFKVSQINKNEFKKFSKFNSYFFDKVL